MPTEAGRASMRRTFKRTEKRHAAGPCQTVEDFIAAGGKVTVLPPVSTSVAEPLTVLPFVDGGEEWLHRRFTRHD